MTTKRLFIFFLFLVCSLSSQENQPTVLVFSTKEDLGRYCADLLVDRIQKNNQNETRTVLGLATGSTPIPVYQALKRFFFTHQLDFSHVITFNLDEYIGLDLTHPQSYHSFMFSQLFTDLLWSVNQPFGIHRENIYIPSEEIETWEYEDLLSSEGPIDIQLLGIGENGHIGFAEPGSSHQGRTAIVDLSESTRRANARFFNGEIEEVPKQAMTMGIGTILEAKQIILIATGKNKADIVQRVLTEPVSELLPATALRSHPDVLVLLDEEAASSFVKFDRNSPLSIIGGILRYKGLQMKDKILKCWFEGYNQRDWDSVQNIYSEDALIHGKDGELRGGQSVVELAKKWLRAFPDARITPLFSSVEKDVVVVHWRVEGTFTNSIRDYPATGKMVAFHGLTCFRFKNQKVIEHWASVDYRPLRPSVPASAL